MKIDRDRVFFLFLALFFFFFAFMDQCAFQISAAANKKFRLWSVCVRIIFIIRYLTIVLSVVVVIIVVVKIIVGST